MESKPQKTNNPKSEKAKKANKPNKTLKIVLIVGSALLAIALVGYLFFQYFYKDPNAAFVVNGKAVPKAEVETAVNISADKYSQDKAQSFQTTIDTAKLKAVAQKYKVEITDADIRKALLVTPYSDIAQGEEPLDPWVATVGYKVAMNNYIELKNAQGKKGFSFVFYYANLTIKSPYRQPPANFGNAEMAQADKDYAKAKADEYHGLLMNKKITPEEALKQLKSDSRLSYGYYLDGSYSTQFGDSPDVQETWQNQVQLTPIVEYINSIKQINKPTDIQTGKISTVPVPSSEQDFKDAYYYFVYMTDVTNQGEEMQATYDNMKVDK